MMTSAQVFEELGKFTGEDAEEAARAWVLEHANEFPEKIRDEIIFQFSMDALLADAEARDAVASMKQQGAVAMDAIEKAKSELENEVRIVELKDQLQK